MPARSFSSDDASAPDGSAASGASAHIDQTCQMAIEGRRAARTLGEWGQQLGLSETELQLLWRLRAELGQGFDQTTLARQLAYSTAQISATVEKLRSRGWIEQVSATSDRRRNLWRLSASGHVPLAELLQRANLQCQQSSDGQTVRGMLREAAA